MRASRSTRPCTSPARLRRPLVLAPVVALAAGAVLLGLAPAASAHGDRERIARMAAMAPEPLAPLMASGNVTHLANDPSQVGISGCFLPTAPLLVTSGLDSVRVWDVSEPTAPALVGVLASSQFENEAMTCGERRTADGVRRFALIGIDTYQASADDIQHVNTGGNELVVVDVTDPAAPFVASRAPATTSTHTVACVEPVDCSYAYSAGERDSFSIFDLRDLDAPHEVDADRAQPGVQPHASPTGGHNWSFDAAGVGTHTGWNGASMWDARDPRRPRLLATTGKAGTGTDPRYPGWNDFILHNSERPHADRFRPNQPPSIRNGNVMLATEEDYEQTDCSLAGSFQTWWVKRLDGRPGGIVPLDKVELADLGNYPLPQGAFCSSHWFDPRPDGLVAAGFYGGGTQLLDVRDARHIRGYGHAFWGLSEVWDAMWVPVYDAAGRRTAQRTNIVYSIDLVRGLDVYAVDLPAGARGVVPVGGAVTDPSPRDAGVLPLGLVSVAALGAVALRRRARARI